MRIEKHWRKGFSFLETLVVIGIIGVVLGILLPAVQGVRTAMSRTECQNHLKQLALASHQYEQVNGALPKGVNADQKDPLVTLTWMVYLLPYVEKEAVWQRALSDCQELPITYIGPPHEGLKTYIDIYVCPADGRLITLHRVTSDYAGGTLVALSSYQGVSGTGTISNNGGVLFSNSSIRMVDITDGMSNTLMIGERPPSQEYTYGWWYSISNDNQGSGILPIPNEVAGMDGANPGINCAKKSYPFGAGSLENICDAFHFWSLHSGGGNFAFCDGSVRFIPYSASDKLSVLATRAGGETISLLD